MRIDLAPLKNKSRLLIQARLRVAAGTAGRFQPTGFPDLGPALYKGFRDPDKNASSEARSIEEEAADVLLVETVQSMANRLEEACLDGEQYNDDCKGIPYVKVLDGHKDKAFLTSSVREPHRLASDYVLLAKRDGELYREELKRALTANKNRPVHIWKMVPEIFSRDPGCVLHGIFLEKIDGRIRLPRLVSSYIEAVDPNQVNYGGVYRGEVTASDNIPYARQEFTAPYISASFILHLGTLRGYGLKDEQSEFLILWALYKVDRFLNGYLRLRTACEFELIGKPDAGNWTWPESTVIQADFKEAKTKCFGDSGIEPVSVVYAVEVKAEVDLSGVQESDLHLNEFKGRAEIVEVGKKDKKKKVLRLTGDWKDEDAQVALLNRHPEFLDGENEKRNAAYDLIKEALKKWDENWKKEQKKAGAETTEEEL